MLSNSFTLQGQTGIKVPSQGAAQDMEDIIRCTEYPAYPAAYDRVAGGEEVNMHERKHLNDPIVRPLQDSEQH